MTGIPDPQQRTARRFLRVVGVVLALLTLALIALPSLAGPAWIWLLTGALALLCLWVARRGSPRAVRWLEMLLTGWP